MQRDHERKWVRQMGSLAAATHFIELCLDESERLWVMLHSGSRGIGNCIGQYFIAAAREVMMKTDIHLPDRDLGWFSEGSKLFDDYVEAVGVGAGLRVREPERNAGADPRGTASPLSRVRGLR